MEGVGGECVFYRKSSRRSLYATEEAEGRRVPVGAHVNRELRVSKQDVGHFVRGDNPREQIIRLNDASEADDISTPPVSIR